MIPKHLFPNYSERSTVLKPSLYKPLSGLSRRKLFSVSAGVLSLPPPPPLSVSLPLLLQSSSIFLCLSNPLAPLVPRSIARVAPPPGGPLLLSLSLKDNYLFRLTHFLSVAVLRILAINHTLPSSCLTFH